MEGRDGPYQADLVVGDLVALFDGFRAHQNDFGSHGGIRLQKRDAHAMDRVVVALHIRIKRIVAEKHPKPILPGLPKIEVPGREPVGRFILLHIAGDKFK